MAAKATRKQAQIKSVQAHVQLTAMEKEVLALKAAVESIDSMMNYEVLKLHHNDPNSEIRFNSITHQKYFNIILLDFLHSDVFQTGQTCLDTLAAIPTNPQFGNKYSSLKRAVIRFKSWLSEDVKLSSDVANGMFWFPSLHSPTLHGSIPLQITRSEFIQVCGNISKHNPLGLDRQAKHIQGIFARNQITINLTQALLAMEDFYGHFHHNIFTYHTSTIGEFLNNIRFGIHEYLKPQYDASLQTYWDKSINRESYKFTFPADVANSFVQMIYWDLMNDIRSGPYIPKFAVNKYFKKCY